MAGDNFVSGHFVIVDLKFSFRFCKSDQVIGRNLQRGCNPCKLVNVGGTSADAITADCGCG